MKTLRTGIVGCGKVAPLHAAALSSLPESRFAAVHSRSLAKARAFAARWPAGPRPFDDLPDMLREVDAVIVGTPHPQHAEAAVLAARAGVHVLVEKPLAATLRGCDEIIGACRAAGVKLGTISQRRWYPPVRRVREAVAAGRIGRPVLADVTVLSWRDQAYYDSDPWRGSWRGEGGGVLVNQSPHQLDLLLWLMGPVEELAGYWDNLNHPGIEVEDTAVAALRFASGALGSILVSNSTKPGLYGKVHVHGSGGASVGVQTDGGAMFVAGMTAILEPPFNDLWTVPGEEGRLEEWKREDARFFASIDPLTWFHRLQVQDFLQAVLEDRPPLVTGEDGRRTVELFTAIYLSGRERRAVRFPLPAEATGGRPL